MHNNHKAIARLLHTDNKFARSGESGQPSFPVGEGGFSLTVWPIGRRAGALLSPVDQELANRIAGKVLSVDLDVIA
jgi:hypothetical protein